MLDSPPSRLLQALRRIGGADAVENSDADLLQQFATRRDEPAFEELLRRHGEMVLRVCRRQLGGGPDAEDAFQAVFLVLARDAARIRRRESLAGWLFRVALHVSRKLMKQNARRRTAPLNEQNGPVADDPPAAERNELTAVVEEEVARLPDHLRSAVVLCCLQGRTGADAAGLLGCPRGTVESRLAAARKRLRSRLVSRGLAPATATGALESLNATDSAAAPILVRRTLAACVQLARTGSAAGAVSDHVLTLVAGVSTAMSTHRLILIAAAAILLAAGGAGLTVFGARADGQRPKAEPAKADPPAKPADSPPPGAAKEPAKPPMVKSGREIREFLKTSHEIHELLQQAFEPSIDHATELPLSSWIEQFRQAAAGVTFVPDQSSLQRDPPIKIYGDESPRVKIAAMPGASIEQVMKAVLSQLDLTYKIRNGAIDVTRGYVTIVPSAGSRPRPKDTDLTPEEILNQEEGERITLSVEEKPLVEVLRDLQGRTGANIVLDVRQKDKGATAVTAFLSDVRLMAALRILCDMCDLQPVFFNNILYVTSRENAERLQQEMDRRRHSAPMPPPAPAGPMPPAKPSGEGAEGK